MNTELQIFDNSEFGYWSVTVERPLRLAVYPERVVPATVFKNDSERGAYEDAISKLAADMPLDDWSAFAKATGLKAALLKKVRPFITEKNPDAKPIEGEADTELRDTEIVPFNYKGGIDAFMKNEVLSYAPDAYIDEKKTQIGYEISFTKYFYKPIELRDMNDILTSLNDLEKQTDGVLAEIIGGICK